MLGFVLDLLSDSTELADSSIESVDSLPCNEFDGVEEGIFNGNAEELNALSEAGMIDGTDHIDSDDIVRNLIARNEFLELCGLDSVPEGYEVHHIIPLSEGGTDDPSNMVLLSSEEHQAITSAHRQFYDWNS